MVRRNGGASTAVLAPIELELAPKIQEVPSITSKRPPSFGGHSLASIGVTPQERQSSGLQDDCNETLPSPTTTSERLEMWNSPRRNIYRVGATFWSFIVMGMNDATYGPIIPYLEEYYGLSYLIVSLIFLSPFVGYNIAALLNNTLHLKLGQRGVAFFGPVLHLISYIVISLHPPYPVLVIVFILAGLGNGFEDSGWNAWIGAMANANEVLGFLHGCYGLGATIAPLIATTLITKAGVPWYYWYYIMVCSVF